MAGSASPLPAIPAGFALGAHMSIAGGFRKAAERARAAGATALQVFTKSSNQWKAKPLDEQDVAAFRESCRAFGLRGLIAHDSYLINLASPDPALYERSIEAFRIELERSERLGLSHLIFHPGAHLGEGEAAGLERVAAALNRLMDERPDCPVKPTIETTAGQGSCLGHRFEHLRDLLGALREPERAAICVDTCHLLAAGYDIRTEAGCEETFEQLDALVGLDRVQAFHLNDSRRPLGSRVDRHEHIGEGEVGEIPFGWILRQRRFRGVPMVLETPKTISGKDGKDDPTLDIQNLTRLVNLFA